MDRTLPGAQPPASDESVAIAGDLTIRQLGALPDRARQARRLDLSRLGRLDTAGAWFLAGREGDGVRLEAVSPEHRGLIDLVAARVPEPKAPPPEPPGIIRLLSALGLWTVKILRQSRELLGYLGRFLVALGRSLRHPSSFPLTALVHHAQETGMKAVPIAALMAFLIAVVIAFQGATLLTQFGAEIYVVDLIAISILRELGVLLTAIIVAGRTASALTASIGSMKMREEIDAMRTLGIDPERALFVPRILALVITLPILTLIADLSGIIGGAAMAWITLGISPPLFLSRMIEETGIWHAFVGLVKAPVFAVIIGVIGCHAGMSVGKDAESLGRMTSEAVVQAIFMVILTDALFSIFFAQVGI
ncbi:MlaE family lipid ABC transporter permease subunit [Paracoccus sp. Z118]|uniref:ABC transporter permease n=1 Tax=Paracoccus sp. Z118 TaxID=2851017 RepID=UPI0020B8A1B1|nr:MlaE family lipid ABC transporter permease subunit [Paracoccus sp. Z118]